MSGGFDSTTLALIAAKALDKQGKKLYTLTEKSLSATESSDVKCAEHAASLYPNIKALTLEANEVPSDRSNLELATLTDAPSLGYYAIARIVQRSKIINSVGSELHLNGDGGDEIFVSSYSYFADLLKRLQFTTFFKHIYGRSRVGNFATIALINRAIKLSFTPYRQWLIEQTKKIQAGDLTLQYSSLRVSLDHIMGWDFIPYFGSWYSQKSLDLVIEEMQKWAEVAVPFAEYPSEHQIRATIQSCGPIVGIQNQIFATHGVNSESPYFDRLVIDAALSAKPEERYSPYAYKPLLPKAFQHDLPQSIFERKTKGDYTRDRLTGFRKNRHALAEIFQNSLSADMGLIDLRELNKAMEQLNMGLMMGSGLFCQTLAVELWLRLLSESNRSFWISID